LKDERLSEVLGRLVVGVGDARPRICGGGSGLGGHEKTAQARLAMGKECAARGRIMEPACAMKKQPRAVLRDAEWYGRDCGER
jgi:hypothetical protein